MSRFFPYFFNLPLCYFLLVFFFFFFIVYYMNRESLGNTLPSAQLVPVNPRVQRHVLGATHIPPFIQAGSHRAVQKNIIKKKKKERKKEKKMFIDIC